MYQFVFTVVFVVWSDACDFPPDNYEKQQADSADSLSGYIYTDATQIGIWVVIGTYQVQVYVLIYRQWTLTSSNVTGIIKKKQQENWIFVQSYDIIHSLVPAATSLIIVNLKIKPCESEDITLSLKCLLCVYIPAVTVGPFNYSCKYLHLSALCYYVIVAQII